jgi:hypothetical protein
MNTLDEIFQRFVQIRQPFKITAEWEDVTWEGKTLGLMKYYVGGFRGYSNIPKGYVYLHPKAPMWIKIVIDGQEVRHEQLTYATDLYIILAETFPKIKYGKNKKGQNIVEYGRMENWDCRHALNLVSLSRHRADIAAWTFENPHNVAYIGTQKQRGSFGVLVYQQINGIQFDRTLSQSSTGEFKLFFHPSSNGKDDVWIEVFHNDKRVWWKFMVTSEKDLIEALLFCCPNQDLQKIRDPTDSNAVLQHDHLHESDLMEPSVWAALDKLSNIAVHICRQQTIEN